MERSETATLIRVEPLEDECILYPNRWLVLFLFVATLFSSLVQMQQYSSISNIVGKYYQVSELEINWSTLVYFLELFILTFPSIYVIEKLGLRRSILICAVGTAVAAWIKVGGVDPQRYWVILLGQAVNGIFCCTLTIVPPKVAAKWFGAKEISLACGIGLITTPFSFALGFLIPTAAVNSLSYDFITNGLYIVNVIYAVFPTILIILLFFYFHEGPPTPPTKTQYFIENQGNIQLNFAKSIKTYVTSVSFMCLALIYSVNAGFYYALTTLLIRIMLNYYPDSESQVGYVGCVINFIGIPGLIFIGILFDKYRRFKLITWIFIILKFILVALFIFFLDRGLTIAFILSGLFGFFYYGVVLGICESGIETTYPEPVVTVFGIFAIGAQALGICFTYLFTYLLNNYHPRTINSILVGIVAIGDASILFVKFKLKRQEALN